jgi:hypothetical protein
MTTTGPQGAQPSSGAQQPAEDGAGAREPFAADDPQVAGRGLPQRPGRPSVRPPTAPPRRRPDRPAVGDPAARPGPAEPPPEEQ